MSVVLGLCFLGLFRLLRLRFIFARLALLFAVISWVPAGLVILAHLREFGRFWWWDKSNAAWTTRRSRKAEKAELIVLTVLWSFIFMFVLIVIFGLSR
jgi:hypothetical protein